MTGLLARMMGLHFHTREGTRWWPTQSIPWIGFIADAKRGVIGIDPGKRRQCMASCDVVVSLPARSAQPARTVLSTVSLLDCLQWIAHGGFAHLRGGWNRPVKVAAEFRNDMCRRRRSWRSSPVKRIRHSASGSLVRLPRLPDLR